MEKYLAVIDPVANIRREPIEATGDYTHDDLQETQVLYNEVLLYRAEVEGWYYVEAIEQKKLTRNCVWQGYPGWIRKSSVTLTDRPARHDITVKYSHALIRKDPSTESVVLFVPPIGTRFTVKESAHNEYYQVLLANGQTGWIDRGDVMRSDIMPAETILRKSIVDTAKLFLGVPYIWGGRSISVADSEERIADSVKQKTEDRRQKTRVSVNANHNARSTVLKRSTLHAPRSTLTGVDCSGLTNLVYRVNNIDIPRDAHDQWVVAKNIAYNQLKPADLLFISAEDRKNQITHVMLYIGGKRFIEALETGSVVQITTCKEKFGINKIKIYPRRVVPI
jgi:cell wall-associated NlpC family hydrolase